MLDGGGEPFQWRVSQCAFCGGVSSKQITPNTKPPTPWHTILHRYSAPPNKELTHVQQGKIMPFAEFKVQPSAVERRGVDG